MSRHIPTILTLFCSYLLTQADPIAELDPQGLAYGPNFQSTSETTSPVVPGAWLPQASVNAAYVWIEPLEELQMGTPMGTEAQFLRFSTDVTLSPWYAMFKATLGLRPVNRLELAFSYSLTGYLFSSQEVESADSDSGASALSLSEAWRSDYLLDHWSEDGCWDYAQTFGILLYFDLSFGRLNAGGEFHHYLIDIATKYDGKVIDYESFLPMYSRDFFYEIMLWASYPILGNWSFSTLTEYQRTGLFSKLLGSYEKEPVQQAEIFAGLTWKSHDKRNVLTIQPGLFWRDSEFLDASLTQKFLFRINWQKTWSWDR